MTLRILILEDEFLVAHELETLISGAGWTAVGPAHTVDEALKLLKSENCDFALLDVNLSRGEVSIPVAAALRERGIPFVVISGYDRSQLPDELADAPLLAKPFVTEHVISHITAHAKNRA